MVKERLIFATTVVHFYKFDAEMMGMKIQLLRQVQVFPLLN